MQEAREAEEREARAKMKRVQDARETEEREERAEMKRVQDALEAEERARMLQSYKDSISSAASASADAAASAWGAFTNWVNPPVPVGEYRWESYGN